MLILGFLFDCKKLSWIFFLAHWLFVAAFIPTITFLLLKAIRVRQPLTDHREKVGCEDEERKRMNLLRHCLPMQ